MKVDAEVFIGSDLKEDFNTVLPDDSKVSFYTTRNHVDWLLQDVCVLDFNSIQYLKNDKCTQCIVIFQRNSGAKITIVFNVLDNSEDAKYFLVHKNIKAPVEEEDLISILTSIIYEKEDIQDEKDD